jgi:hypothetical protein
MSDDSAAATDSTSYQHGGAFSCAACGQAYTPAYPLPIGAFDALMAWWRATHRDCVPRGPK